MWIRSQDKEKIVKCENVFIAYDNFVYIIKSFVEKYNYFNLGEYSSKEKALKVLDMFQEFVTKGTKITRIFNNYSMEYTNNYEIENNVFQMPQDEEVK